MPLSAWCLLSDNEMDRGAFGLSGHPFGRMELMALRVCHLAAAGLVALLALAPANAELRGRQNIVKVGAVGVQFQDASGSLQGLNPSNITVDVNNTTTVGGTYTRMITDNVGVEGVFGLPLEVGINGTGFAQPFGEVVTTKALPLVGHVNYYFGDADSRFRPFVGVSGVYAVFYDTGPSARLNQELFGNTEIKVRNAAGLGVQAGLNARLGDSPYILSAQVSYLSLSTDADLKTDTVLPIFGGIPIGQFDRSINLQLDPVVGIVSVGREF
jgi:outer membrane protein